MSFVPLGVQLEDDEAQQSLPTQQRVIELINDAQLCEKDEKVACLQQVKELITKKDTNLLDSFLDEVMAFMQDQSADVRKFVVGFMEDACKVDPGLVLRVIPLLSYMMDDLSINVIKRLLVCVLHVYKLAFIYVSKLKTVEDDVQEMWETMKDIKEGVCKMIEHDNDGIRTMAIKFMEVLILAQTKKAVTAEPIKPSESDLCLEMVPASHPLLNVDELREEAGTAMGSLLAFTASPAISSVNLMTCISSLTSIAKQRSNYTTTVLQTFELLYANLPAHFATSQITSVRKQLKTQVLSLLKQPSSYECRDQITTLLTDLGCTQAEIAKNTPKVSGESKKRVRLDNDGGPNSKRPRPLSTEPKTGGIGGGAGGVADPRLGVTSAESISGGTAADEKTSSVSGTALMEAIELTTADLKPLLTPENVTELVMATMKSLPPHQPKTFRSSYTPIAAAGTDAQVTHLARLLASQMTSAGLGVGAMAKGIKPHSMQQQPQPPEEALLPRSTSPVVRDPRKRRREETSEENETKKRRKEKSAEPEASSTSEEHDLEKSMVELAYLGSLLGMPNILDPAFPLAYATFFGSLPSTEEEMEQGAANMGIGEGRIKVEPGTDQHVHDPAYVHASNLVAIPSTPKDEAPKEMVKKERRKSQPVLPQKLKKIKVFDLSTVVKPLAVEQLESLSISSFKRILSCEKNSLHRAGSEDRIKLIISLVTQFGEELNSTLLEFILEDLRERFELASAWLFAEYSISEGYMMRGAHEHHHHQYDVCLTGLLNGAKQKLEPRDRLFTKLVLEAPRITHSALNIIKSYCCEEDRAFLGVSTLKELVLKRPQGPDGTENFLQALLEVTMGNIELARIQALHISKKFYAKPELASKIERFALHTLQYLLSDHPSFLTTETTDDQGVEVALEWTEASVKICFSPFLTILPLNHRLLKDLAFVYTNTSPSVKRIILRHLDQPVRDIGMASPDLLQLVENCPQGGETLIMRMLHILTEGGSPSPELVKRVRELYHRNSSDVRFLIPVLHGLQKQEVVAALPSFIRLSPNLVKGVFDKLLVSYKGDQVHSISPITPSELLIALHNIDCKDDEALMKSVIKATNLCFQEKSVYTQEVLAVVLQQLLEQTPLPVLFMRTVLQSLGICPKLLSFVMTVLVKLITKQVWKQPKVWQGFIRCCLQTKPHSFQVLLQLPQRQLENVLELYPTIRPPLITYVQNMNPYQRACINRSLLQAIEREPDSSKTGKKNKKDPSQKKRRQSSKSDGKGTENKDSENQTATVENKENPPVS